MIIAANQNYRIMWSEIRNYLVVENNTIYIDIVSFLYFINTNTCPAISFITKYIAFICLNYHENRLCRTYRVTNILMYIISSYSIFRLHVVHRIMLNELWISFWFLLPLEGCKDITRGEMVEVKYFNTIHTFYIEYSYEEKIRFK